LEALPDDGGGTKIQQQSSLPGVVGAPLGGCVCPGGATNLVTWTGDVTILLRLRLSSPQELP